MNKSYVFFLVLCYCSIALFFNACKPEEDAPIEVVASIAGYPIGTIIPETDFEVIDKWEVSQDLNLVNNNKDLFRGTNLNTHSSFALADSGYRIPRDIDFELRLKVLALGSQTSAYNTDLVVGLDDEQNLQSSPDMPAHMRILRVWDRAQYSLNLTGTKSGIKAIPQSPLAVGDAVFVRRTQSDVLAQTKWEYGIIRVDGTEVIIGESTGFNFDGDARPKASLALNGMRAQLLLVTELTANGNIPNPGTGLPSPPISYTPDTTYVEKWEATSFASIRDNGRTVFRWRTQENSKQYAIADSSYKIPHTQDFELRAKILRFGDQATSYSSDLVLGLDAENAITLNDKFDALIRLTSDGNRTHSTMDNVQGHYTRDPSIPPIYIRGGDELFVRRYHSQDPSQTTWEFGVFRAKDQREYITGSGVGFNFPGYARPKLSLGCLGMKVELMLIRILSDTIQTPAPAPIPPATPPTPPSPPSGAGKTYVMRHATNSTNFSAWETFDPNIRNYDAANRKINRYFRTHITRLNTTYGGVEWSTDEAPLIPTDGQVMKVWAKLQNPSSFRSGIIARAELEPQDYMRTIGWDVYDSQIPQTRAYSFAFKLPDDFTYSTSGGSPGTIAEKGYNWIISQWHDGGSPITPPYAIHMRGTDLLFREKIYGNWFPILSNIDQEFRQGKWLVFLAIVKWTTANDGYFNLYYDWADPANPTPTNWKLAISRTNKPTIHPQARWKVTGAWRIGGYYWLLAYPNVNQQLWNDNAGSNRNLVMYYDQWRAIRLDDPRFSNFTETDIKEYFELLTQ